MAETRRFGLADGLLLLGILALAAGARAGYLMSCADQGRNGGPLVVESPSPTVTPPLSDKLAAKPATELDVLVHKVKDNQPFASVAPFAAREEPTAHVAPGYPWLLGMLARVIDPAALDQTVRWIQCGLGALTAGLYFLFAARAFRSRFVGVLSGLLCAVHPFWVIDTAALREGVLATFLLGLALWLGGRAAQAGVGVLRTGPQAGPPEGGAFASLLYGLALAALALVRAALLPFAFLGLCWFLLRSRDLRHGWLCALLAFLGFLIGVAPWTVRNYQQFAEPVPIIDSTYMHLWIGNNPHATGGPLGPEAMESASTEDLKKLPQPERYRQLSGSVRQEIQDHPVETVRRRLWAGLDFFFGERWLRDGVLAERTDANGPSPAWLEWTYPVALQWTLLIMTALGLLGWRWTYAFRRGAMPSSLAVVWIPLPYILSHAGALSGPRLPLDGVLLCYTAFVVAYLIPGVGRRLREGDRVAEAPAEEVRRELPRSELPSARR